MTRPGSNRQPRKGFQMGSSITSKGQRRIAFPQPEDMSEFVKTHCHTCVYGWTRTNPQGNQLAVCLLDREPIYSNLTDCSRYEQPETEDTENEQAAPPEAGKP